MYSAAGLAEDQMFHKKPLKIVIFFFCLILVLYSLIICVLSSPLIYYILQ